MTPRVGAAAGTVLTPGAVPVHGGRLSTTAWEDRMSVQSPVDVTSASRLRARRGVVLFLVSVAAFDVVLTTVIVVTGNPVWILVLMWSVAVSSLICRLVLREGIRDVSFRFGGKRTLAYLAAAVVFPLVVGFIAYGVAWITGVATFTPTSSGFPLLLLSLATLGTVLGAVTAAGEEIGWRGYLLTRLIDAGVPRPVLVSGVIWGLWRVSPDRCWRLRRRLRTVTTTDRPAIHGCGGQLRRHHCPLPSGDGQRLAGHRPARRLEQHHPGRFRPIHHGCERGAVDR